MKKGLTFLFLLMCLFTRAQSKNYFSAAFTDQCTTYPYAKAFGLVNEPMHPGIELAWGKKVREKLKHDWYREILAGYFYHRFLQHGIPLYLQYGYRYKFTRKFSAESALGAGYFHSIATEEVFTRDANGSYHTAKGIGRPQVMGAFTVGAGYQLQWMKGQPVRIYLQYQVRLQAPFVKSYVPILPYTQVALGISTFFNTPKKK